MIPYRLKLKFPIAPFVKQSTRFGKGRAYKDPKIKALEEKIQLMFLEIKPRGFQMFTGPIRITKAEYRFRLPKSAKAEWRKAVESGRLVLKATRPDLTDNLFKGVIDALSGLVFQDDSQIVEMCHVRKVYAAEPAIILEFEVVHNMIVD